MKIIYYILFFYSFISCTFNNEFELCETLSSLTNTEIHEGKSCLVFLQGEEEKLTKIDLCKIYNLFKNKYSCVEASDSLALVLKKILCYPKNPVFVVIKSDTFSSIVLYRNINDLSYNIENENYTLDYIDEYFNLNTINNALKKQLLMRNERYMNNEIDLRYDMNKSYFYDIYLLALYCKNIKQYDLAEKIYLQLWDNSTKEEKEMYPEEYLDVVKNKNGLIKISNKDLLVDKKIIDFGNLKLNERKQEVIIISNNSFKPFVISSIRPSCGCTIVLWNRKPIYPGSKDSIIVDFKGVQIGFNLKNISLIGNCDEMINIKIKACVIK